MEALEMVCQRFGGGKRQTDGSFMCKCPAHEDRAASLHLTEGKDGRVLVKCHAGCETRSVLAKVDLTLADLFPPKEKRASASGKSKIEKVYDYHDLDGQLRHQTVRYKPKKFLQRQPDPSLKQPWIWNLDGITPILYRLAATYAAAQAGRLVLLTEGEKDADAAVEKLGATATTSPMGAGKWREHYVPYLEGAHVAIVADKDEPGRKHARDIAKSLQGKVKSIRVLEMPGEGKDLSDWIDAGGTRENFRELLRSTPQWTAEEAPKVVSIEEAKQQAPPEQPWPAPVPIGPPKPPAFPVEALPEALGRFVEQQAHFTQTPVEATALVALAVCAAAVAKKARVEIVDGWQEPLNLYAAVVLGPAERKSAIMGACRAPLEAYEREMLVAMRGDVEATRTKKEVLEHKARSAKQRASRSQDPDTMEAAIRAAQDAAAYKAQAALRLLIDDITTEKVVGMLEEQGGRIALFSEEGGIFDTMAGHYSKGSPRLDVYLKGHSGDTIRVDRIGRPPEIVEQPAITLGLAIQPEIIRRLAKQSAFRGQGLLARFLYVMPESMLGRRLIEVPAVEQQAWNAYCVAVRSLLELPMSQEAGKPRPFILRFDPEALARFRAFQEWLEPMLSSYGELGSLSDWGGKLAGATARMAGILHLVEHAQALSPWNGRIGVLAVERAIQIAQCLIPHAQAAFAELELDERMQRTSFLLRWIEQNKRPTFSKRDLHQGVRGRIKAASDIEEPLRLLQEHGYVRPFLRISEKKQKGRRSEEYSINPILCNFENIEDASNTHASRTVDTHHTYAHRTGSQYTQNIQSIENKELYSISNNTLKNLKNLENSMSSDSEDAFRGSDTQNTAREPGMEG